MEPITASYVTCPRCLRTLNYVGQGHACVRDADVVMKPDEKTENVFFKNVVDTFDDLNVVIRNRAFLIRRRIAFMSDLAQQNIDKIVVIYELNKK